MSLEKILEEFGTTLVNDTRNSWDSERAKKAAKHGSSLNPNSRLNASMSYEVDYDNDVLFMSFKMAEHYVFPNKGRGIGGVSQAGQKSLAEWIRRTGIKPKIVKKTSSVTKKRKKPLKSYSFEQRVKSMVYVISRKIKEKGYEGTGFWDKVIKDGRVEKLRELIKQEIKKDIEIIFKVN